ncbi:MAG: MarC family protein [Chloroflexota bacterium]
MEQVLAGLKEFHLVFLPLLVVMDPLGVLPFLAAFTGVMPAAMRARIHRTALFTGLVVGVLFLLAGRAVFALLGVQVYHFLVAGGAVLFALALREMMTSGAEPPAEPDELMAVVPIGTPLLVGPATISLLLVLAALHPLWLVVAAFVANMAIAWLVFSQTGRLVRWVGAGGLRAFNKVMYLLLAAIAVKLITDGIVQTIAAVD